MKSYTVSEARQQFTMLLEQARKDGSVRIQRRDGQSFILTPEQRKKSPLDIKSIDIGITSDEIVELIRESRRNF